MEENIKAKAQEWLHSNIDDDTKREIEKLLHAGDSTELVDAFYKDLEFGTGGLRGIMGVGSNRVNKYTIGKATQGLSNYLLKAFPATQVKVAIAHDSRNNSRFFAEVTAAVFSANGIKVYFFEDLRPTPELSFAIRELGCQSGVVITASHNPKEYNGYKAYWNDGGQVTPPHDKNIIAEVDRIESFDQVKFQKNESLIETMGENLDSKYIARLKGLSISPEIIARQKDLKIVFSSIHGTGITLAPRILKEFGFQNVHTVKEQDTPDGNFPTVVYPNPEETEAMTLALKKARELDADLILATDPDADRVGMGAKNLKGEFQLLNGNQTAVLLTYYMLNQWKAKGRINGKQYIVKTIVTTDLLADIAREFGVECFETLTGFKYIAEVLKDLEGKKEFIVGGEESYGYLSGDFVRDKDAISSCAMIAEMTAYAKEQGLGAFDLLADIYQQFGFYKESLLSLTKKGKSGSEEIQEMMKNLRANPPKQLGGSALVKMVDYQSGREKDVESGAEKDVNFPKSNVLQFFTADGSKISARPSGTEPKIKFYFAVKGKLARKEDFEATEKALEDKIKQIIKELKLQ